MGWLFSQIKFRHRGVEKEHVSVRARSKEKLGRVREVASSGSEKEKARATKKTKRGKV